METSEPHTTAPNTVDPDPRIVQLVAAVERRLAETAERAEQTTAAIERLAASIDAMPASSTTGNGDFSSVLHNTTEAMEQAQRVREIVATLPEIASSQVDAISSLDERLSTLGNHVQTVDERVSNLRDERLQSDQVTIQVSNTQRQIARALNVLRDMLLKQAEQSTGIAAEVQDLKDALISQHQNLRTHVTRQIETSTPRVGPATAFSIVAALAALGTLALLLLQQYG